MKQLKVYIEIDGIQVHVGDLQGESSASTFTYAETYLDSGGRPISIHLPLQKESFDAASTKVFFDGLLPEGFTRGSVAQWLRVNADDFFSILAALGSECLGAIRIEEEGAETVPADYRKMSDEEWRRLAEEGALETAQMVTESHLSLTGASGKVGMYYDETDGSWYRPFGEAPSTHIIKQSHVRLKDIVVNEQLCQLTAEQMGISVPESFVIEPLRQKDNTCLFATKRYDRSFKGECRLIAGLRAPLRLHQEDFGQAMGIAAEDKYEKPGKHYLKEMFALIRAHAADPIVDQLKLWDRVVFNYLIGNTDSHIKNYALLYTSDLKTVSLAPAYDMLSTVIYSGSTKEMSFNIGGKYDLQSIRRTDFGHMAEEVGMSERLALKRFDGLADSFEKALEKASLVLQEQGFSQAAVLRSRILSQGGAAKI